MSGEFLRRAAIQINDLNHTLTLVIFKADVMARHRLHIMTRVERPRAAPRGTLTRCARARQLVMNHRRL
jgi:hypothetical protein